MYKFHPPKPLNPKHQAALEPAAHCDFGVLVLHVNLI